MFESLRAFIPGRRRRRIIRECRRCGVSVDADASRCPDCESTAIARYEIP